MADRSTAPDFSPLASTYVRARPRYPAALYAWIASHVAGHELAWDCATGSGQAAVGLAEHFTRVVATDRSAEQLAHAPAHPHIEYRRAPAERSGLADASVDVVTVAAALHWLDHASFFAEVRRVTRPGGVFAAWTYHAAGVDAPFDEVFRRGYWELLKPFMAPHTDLVDAGYATIDVPGEPIAAPSFAIDTRWSLDTALDYVRSWSAAPAYREVHGVDVGEVLRPELEAVFARAGAAVLPVRLPLFLRVHRL